MFEQFNIADSLFSCCVSCEIADKTGVLENTEDMKKKQDILKEHSIWYSDKEGYWYCSLPSKTSKNGRKNVKRKERADIEKVLYDFYLKQEQQENNRKESMTLEELFLEFIEYKKGLVKSGTIKRMATDWKKFYKPHIEITQKPFKDITKIDVDTFFNKVADEHNLKDKAFRNMCGVLKQTFEYAVDAEYIEKNPYRVKVNKKKIRPSRKNDNLKEIFLPEEQKQLIAEMERRLLNNPSNTAPLAIMLDFEIGVRKGEMLGLRYSDIINGKIHVCRQVTEYYSEADINNISRLGFEVVNYTKSDCGDRWIPLTDNAIHIINRIKKINEENNEFFDNYLFVRDGKIMVPTTLDTQLLRGCDYIGIPRRTIHKIRKTYASTLYKNNVPISVISKLLGHADEATTFKSYIYNLDNNDATEDLVLNALQGNTTSRVKDAKNVREREGKVIAFPTNRKAENPALLGAFR